MNKIILVILLVLVLSAPLTAQTYSIERSVIASGGGTASSSGYTVKGTFGQSITGFSSSPSYGIASGFWAGAGGTGSGCEYAVGDANNSGGFNGLDVTYGVNYFKGGSAPPYVCECTPGNNWFVGGDVNSSCSYNGLDITYGVNYFKGGSNPIPCGDCPPNGVILASQRGSEIVKPADVLGNEPNSKVEKTDRSKRVVVGTEVFDN